MNYCGTEPESRNSVTPDWEQVVDQGWTWGCAWAPGWELATPQGRRGARRAQAVQDRSRMTIERSWASWAWWRRQWTEQLAGNLKWSHEVALSVSVFLEKAMLIIIDYNNSEKYWPLTCPYTPTSRRSVFPCLPLCTLPHSLSRSTPFTLTPRNSLLTSLPLTVSPTRGHNRVFSLTHPSSHTLTLAGPHSHGLMPVFTRSRALTHSAHARHTLTHTCTVTRGHPHILTGTLSLLLTHARSLPHVHSQTLTSRTFSPRLTRFLSCILTCEHVILLCWVHFFFSLFFFGCVCARTQLLES